MQLFNAVCSWVNSFSAMKSHDSRHILGIRKKIMNHCKWKFHTTWQHVLIQIKSPNDLDTCHVKWVPETTFWHKKLNQTLGPFGDSSWHAQPILPKFGGVFCLCTIGPQKGPKVSFDSLCQKVVLGVQTTFQVSKLFGLLICINTSCQVVWYLNVFTFIL